MRIFIICLFFIGNCLAVDIPKSDYGVGSLIKAEDINKSIKNTSGFLKDDDENPTVCMKLKLKAGLHQISYIPVDCQTGTDLGLIKDSNDIWQIGSGGNKASCLDYYNNYLDAQTVNGKYLIDADGFETAYAPQVVYCDMTSGGYTRVVVIHGANQSHLSSSSISPDSVADGLGGTKFSDTLINKLVTVEIKLNCDGRIMTRDNSCIFHADSDISGSSCFDNIDGNSKGVNQTSPFAVYYGHATATGCHGSNWTANGMLWVK